MRSVDLLAKECQELISYVYSQVAHHLNEEVRVELPTVERGSVQEGYLVNQLKQRDFDVKVVATESGIALILK